MEIGVVGGTGSLGALVVEELLGRGHEVRVLTRRALATLPAGASHRRVDLSTGDGLRDALTGLEVAVDAANDSRRADDVLVEGGRRLAAAEAEAGIRHHVAISIVGCDRLPLGYYRAKVAQEEVVAASSVPWTLLRASQFHTLIAGALQAADRLRVRPTGRAQLQPIDPAIVAERLASAALDEPAGRLPDVAGPEQRSLTELSDAWRRHVGRALVPVRLPMVGGVGRALREGALCDPAAAAGGPTFADWLAARRG